MSGGTTIIRDAPRGRRTGGRTTAGFVVPMPALRALAGSTLDELQLAVRAYPGLTVWLTGVGALLWPLTLVGLALVAPAPQSLGERMPSREEVAGWYATAGAVAGAVVGTLQWLAMRRLVPRVMLWIPLTAAGWALALAPAVGLANEVSRWLRTILYGGRFPFWAPEWERYVLLAVVGAAVGLTLGLAQWVALRRARAPLTRRSIWIAASALAWTVGFAFVPVVPRVPDFVQRMGRYSGGFDFAMPALILSGAFYGLLTAFALTRLLRAAAPRPVET